MFHYYDVVIFVIVKRVPSKMDFFNVDFITGFPKNVVK